MYSENTRKESMRTWRRRKETLGVLSKYAKRHKSANISVNKKMNKTIFQIHTNYTIWDGLSHKTISRYCLFKDTITDTEDRYIKIIYFENYLDLFQRSKNFKTFCFTKKVQYLQCCSIPHSYFQKRVIKLHSKKTRFSTRRS